MYTSFRCLILLLTGLCTFHTHGEEETQLLYGVADRTHTSTINYSQTTTGLLPDIVKITFNPTGNTIKFIKLPKRRIMHSLRNGTIHVSSQAVIDEYAHLFNLPDNLIIGEEAYLTTSYHIFTLKDSNISISNLDDIRNHHIGILINNPVSEYVKKSTLVAEHLETIYSDGQRMTKGLLSNRVDIIFGSLSQVYESLEELGVKPNQIKSVYRVGTVNRYFVFSETALGNRAFTLRNETDQNLRQIKTDNTISKLIQKHAKKLWYE